MTERKKKTRGKAKGNKFEFKIMWKFVGPAAFYFGISHFVLKTEIHNRI